MYQAEPEDYTHFQYNCCVPNTTAEALSGQKPAKRSFCSLVASGFPWGGFGCQVGASIDPDQLTHACEELIAFAVPGGGDASRGGCLVLICGQSALLPQSTSHQDLVEHWLAWGPACVLSSSTDLTTCWSIITL